MTKVPDNIHLDWCLLGEPQIAAATRRAEEAEGSWRQACQLADTLRRRAEDAEKYKGLNRKEATMGHVQSTEILAERVKFDIIGKTESGHELRVWTDGERVVWQDDEGRSGYIPAMLFRVAAHMLADYCEDLAIKFGEDGDNFFGMVHDSLRTPVSLAMAHPYWAQLDHEANDLRFGFTSIASNMAMDVQPDGLKPRAST